MLHTDQVNSEESREEARRVQRLAVEELLKRQ
jgi:hypothetical protein